MHHSKFHLQTCRYIPSFSREVPEALIPLQEKGIPSLQTKRADVMNTYKASEVVPIQRKHATNNAVEQNRKPVAILYFFPRQKKK